MGALIFNKKTTNQFKDTLLTEKKEEKVQDTCNQRSKIEKGENKIDDNGNHETDGKHWTTCAMDEWMPTRPLVGHSQPILQQRDAVKMIYRET